MGLGLVFEDLLQQQSGRRSVGPAEPRARWPSGRTWTSWRFWWKRARFSWRRRHTAERSLSRTDNRTDRGSQTTGGVSPATGGRAHTAAPSLRPARSWTARWWRRTCARAWRDARWGLGQSREFPSGIVSLQLLRNDPEGQRCRISRRSGTRCSVGVGDLRSVRMKHHSIVLLLFIALGLSVPVWAHHSFQA